MKNNLFKILSMVFMGGILIVLVFGIFSDFVFAENCPTGQIYNLGKCIDNPSPIINQPPSLSLPPPGTSQSTLGGNAAPQPGINQQPNVPPSKYDLKSAPMDLYKNTSITEMNYKPQTEFLKGATDPGALVIKFYEYALGVVGIVALGVIIYGAILWIVSTGNPSKIQEAKSWITGAIWGIALLLGATLILRTINPRLAEIGKIESSIEGEIKDLKIKKETVPNILSGFNLEESSGTYKTPEQINQSYNAATGDVYNESQARDEITKAGIGAKKECLNGKSENCVSFCASSCIKRSTLDEVKNLAVASKAEVFITSATEGDHSGGRLSHAEGFKVDLRPSDDLNNFIRNGGNNGYSLTQKGYRKDVDGELLPMFIHDNGSVTTTYVYEPQKGNRGAHWDVLVVPSSATPT